MSKTVSNIICGIAHTVTLPLSTRQKAKTLSRVSEKLADEGKTALATKHGDIHLLAGAGAGIASAAARFFEDEPETLAWIDDLIKPGETLWDIGANVGLYTLYAAKRGAVVYAFEPSAFNFALLVDHARINNLSHNIKPFCVAFSDADGLADLQMRAVGAGEASNSLGQAENQFGAFKPAFTQTVIAMTVDSFAAKFSLTPDHIKLDVDGLEPLILKGATQTLKKVKSLAIEIEGQNAANAQSLLDMIAASGLTEDPSRAGQGHNRNRLFVR